MDLVCLIYVYKNQNVKMTQWAFIGGYVPDYYVIELLEFSILNQFVISSLFANIGELVAG